MFTTKLALPGGVGQRVWSALARGAETDACLRAWLFNARLIRAAPFPVFLHDLSRLLKHFPPRWWGVELDRLVDKRLLTRHDANACTEALLHFTTAAGHWR